MSPYLPLSVAIVAEVVATTAMKSSDGFTRLWPSLIVVAGYMVAFYFLSMTFRTLPTGIADAMWAGAGIVLITLLGWIIHKQTLDLPALLGMSLIVSGVLVINIFSKSGAH